MEPMVLTINPFLVMLAVGGFVAGWFLGGWYKTQRQTKSKDEVVEEAKALTEAKFIAGFKVIMNEIEKLKAK